uniref:cytochrome c oxidase subunit II n=1 Tax=Lebertia trifurcilla TaxID=450597 RepID=UPI0021145310|nr:cytochrome c oxidase subunit II [Lebertia trifurcilla]UTE89507.1 cytochrome c oxidase subunit II [Lebertia trifurcilla]
MPTWMSISFQDSNSPLMEHLSFFHDHTMIIVAAITTMIAYLLISSTMSKSFSRIESESQEMELFWTSLPVGMLIFIAMPSLKILYMADELMDPSLTLKTMGHQWFWSYEYSEFSTVNFDSYMQSDLIPRLIETNNHIILPNKTPIRMVVSSSDVIHSWTIPSLGIKADAVPGRLNQLFILMNRIGILTGQCSEICGSNHSFMPITISSIPAEYFIESIMKM